MKKNSIISNEAQGVSLEGTLAVQQFLQDNYLFRRNVLNRKVELAIKPAEDEAPLWRPLTQEALNSIIIRAKREGVCEKGSPKTDIVEYVHSEEIDVHNPIGEFINGLPQWDGQNHLAQLFSRLPGLSSEQMNYLTVWLRSAVAHWLQILRR